MIVTKPRFTTCLAAAIATAMSGSVNAADGSYSTTVASIDSTPAFGTLKGDSLPTGSTKGNACYARVSVPAVYKTEEVSTEVLPKFNRYNISQARFKDDTRKVTVKPAMTSLTPVQPVIEKTKEKLEIMPASKQWVRGSLKSKQPLTEGEMSDIKLSGLDMGTVKPGTCLYEHYQEATIEKIPTKVMISEATEKLTVVEAKFSNQNESVTLKPEFTRMIEVPPTFKKSSTQVLIEPATKKWQPGGGAIQKVDHMTGETLCLVDVPAKYETVATQIVDVPALVTKVNEEAKVKNFKVKSLISDASEKRIPIAARYDSIDRLKVTKEASYLWLPRKSRNRVNGVATGRAACLVETPAKFANYTREVVKTAGRFERKSIPAEIKEVKVQALVAEATSSQFMTTPKTEIVERRVMVSDARIEWQPVLCELNMTKDIIVSLQRALSRKGYRPGPIDGVLGRATRTAMRKYQRDNQLADGGITIEILEKLGIDI